MSSISRHAVVTDRQIAASILREQGFTFLQIQEGFAEMEAWEIRQFLREQYEATPEYERPAPARWWFEDFYRARRIAKGKPVLERSDDDLPF